MGNNSKTKNVHNNNNNNNNKNNNNNITMMIWSTLSAVPSLTNLHGLDGGYGQKNHKSPTLITRNDIISNIWYNSFKHVKKVVSLINEISIVIIREDFIVANSRKKRKELQDLYYQQQEQQQEQEEQ